MSAVYSSNNSSASDSLVSQPLNAVHPSQNFSERPAAKQSSSALSSTTVEAGSEFQLVASADTRDDSSSLALDANDCCDNVLLRMEHLEALNIGKERITDTLSVAVNSSIHKSDDSVVDVSSVITDSDVDSSTFSSHLCCSEFSTADVDYSTLQDVTVKPKRPTHGRSASESGIFSNSQSSLNITQPAHGHKRYEQGIE